MRKKIGGIIIAVTGGVIVFIVLVFSSNLREKKGFLYDFFMKISRKTEVSKDIIIVEEDFKTRSLLPEFDRLREHYYLTLLDSLKQAKVIVVNEIFWGVRGDSIKPDSDLANNFLSRDSLLRNNKVFEYSKKEIKNWIKVLQNNKNVILAIKFINKSNGKSLLFGYPSEHFPVHFIEFNNYFAPPGSLIIASYDIGVSNVFPEIDGKLRGVPLFLTYHKKVYPSLPLASVLMFLELPPKFKSVNNMTIGKGRNIPILRDKKLLLSFSRKKITKYSMVDLLKADFQKVDISGKIVFIGQNEKKFISSTGVPLGDLDVMAMASSDLLTKNYIRFSSERDVLIITLIFSLFLSVIILYFRWKGILSFSILAIAGYTFMIYVNLSRNVWIKPYLTIISGFFSLLSSLVWKYIYEWFPRRKFKDILRHYLSKEDFRRLNSEGAFFPYTTELQIGTVVNIKFYPEIRKWSKNSSNINYRIFNELLTNITELILPIGGKIVGFNGFSIYLLFPYEDGPILAIKFIHKFRKAFSLITGRWQSEGWGKWNNFSMGVVTNNITMSTTGKYPHSFFHITNTRAFEANFIEKLNIEFDKYTIFIDERTYEATKDLILAEELGILEIEGEEIKVYEFKRLKE